MARSTANRTPSPYRDEGSVSSRTRSKQPFLVGDDDDLFAMSTDSGRGTKYGRVAFEMDVSSEGGRGRRMGSRSDAGRGKSKARLSEVVVEPEEEKKPEVVTVPVAIKNDAPRPTPLDYTISGTTTGSLSFSNLRSRETSHVSESGEEELVSSLTHDEATTGSEIMKSLNLTEMLSTGQKIDPATWSLLMKLAPEGATAKQSPKASMLPPSDPDVTPTAPSTKTGFKVKAYSNSPTLPSSSPPINIKPSPPSPTLPPSPSPQQPRQAYSHSSSSASTSSAGIPHRQASGWSRSSSEWTTLGWNKNTNSFNMTEDEMRDKEEKLKRVKRNMEKFERDVRREKEEKRNKESGKRRKGKERKDDKRTELDGTGEMCVSEIGRGLTTHHKEKDKEKHHHHHHHHHKERHSISKIKKESIEVFTFASPPTHPLPSPSLPQPHSNSTATNPLPPPPRRKHSIIPSGHSSMYGPRYTGRTLARHITVPTANRATVATGNPMLPPRWTGNLGPPIGSSSAAERKRRSNAPPPMGMWPEESIRESEEHMYEDGGTVGGRVVDENYVGETGAVTTTGYASGGYGYEGAHDDALNWVERSAMTGGFGGAAGIREGARVGGGKDDGLPEMIHDGNGNWRFRNKEDEVKYMREVNKRMKGTGTFLGQLADFATQSYDTAKRNMAAYSESRFGEIDENGREISGPATRNYEEMPRVPVEDAGVQMNWDRKLSRMERENQLAPRPEGSSLPVSEALPFNASANDWASCWPSASSAGANYNLINSNPTSSATREISNPSSILKKQKSSNVYQDAIYGGRVSNSANLISSAVPAPSLPSNPPGGYDPLMPPPPLPSASNNRGSFTGYRSSNKRKRSDVEDGYEDTQFSRATNHEIPDLDVAWSVNPGTYFTRGGMPTPSTVVRGNSGGMLPSVMERDFARLNREPDDEVDMRTESGRGRSKEEEKEKDKDATPTRKKMRRE